MSEYNLVSFFGLFVLMAFAWLFSTNRRVVNWRVVGWGVGLQLLLGLIVFQAPGSTDVFVWLDGVVSKVLDAATAGQYFLFGRLALRPGETGPIGDTSLGFFLAIRSLPLIIFFAALMALLYHWRIMPVIIRGFAWLFTRLMRISGAESLCTASEIFVGIESATAVRPYLSRMTRSEFCVILTAGMATVASSTMGIYVDFLHKTFPTIAGHLMSASLMSAPAAIVMAKLLVPEEETPVTLGRHIEFMVERSGGSIDAIIDGAMAGVKMVVGICALLIAFYGLLALVNLGLDTCGLWRLEKVLGYVMAPFAIVMGTPPSDALLVGQMLGERLILTEVPAYQHLSGAMTAKQLSDPRSAVIAAYALCGFAHVASLAIFVGGIAGLVPERRRDLVAVGPRALLAATLACFMTGCVAGTFYSGAATVLGAK